jgi:hypothetical protein
MMAGFSLVSVVCCCRQAFHNTTLEVHLRQYRTMSYSCHFMTTDQLCYQYSKGAKSPQLADAVVDWVVDDDLD